MVAVHYNISRCHASHSRPLDLSSPSAWLIQIHESVITVNVELESVWQIVMDV